MRNPTAALLGVGSLPLGRCVAEGLSGTAVTILVAADPSLPFQAWLSLGAFLPS